MRCNNCKRDTHHIKVAPNIIVHLILSLLTGGFWLPVWAIIYFASNEYYCAACGNTKYCTLQEITGKKK